MRDAKATRVVMITGANSGIGKAAARRFAADGWQVVMACRNLGSGRAAQQEIAAAAGHTGVDLMWLDVCSFESIRRFAADFECRYRRLDVLIHNAGYFNHGVRTYQFSPDGLELTFATNVFGPLLLTELLLGHLERSPDPRVLHAGSTNIKHFFDPKRQIEFDNLRGEFAGRRPYAVYKMYGDSKMGLLLLTYRMAEEYRSRGIKVNMVMIPATRVSRETLRKFSGHFRIIGPIVQNLNPFALSPEQMAECYHHICTSEEFRQVTGALVDSRGRIIGPAKTKALTPLELARELRNMRHAPAYACDQANIDRMWQLSQEVIAR